MGPLLPPLLESSSSSILTSSSACDAMKEEPALEEEGSWEAVTIPQARCADRLISYIINDIFI